MLERVPSQGQRTATACRLLAADVLGGVRLGTWNFINFEWKNLTAISLSKTKTKKKR